MSTDSDEKHRIQFDDTATRTFEYPSEASMLEFEGTSVDAETSVSGDQSTAATIGNRSASTSLPSLLETSHNDNLNLSMDLDVHLDFDPLEESLV